MERGMEPDFSVISAELAENDQDGYATTTTVMVDESMYDNSVFSNLATHPQEESGEIFAYENMPSASSKESISAPYDNLASSRDNLLAPADIDDKLDAKSSRSSKVSRSSNIGEGQYAQLAASPDCNDDVGRSETLSSGAGFKGQEIILNSPDHIDETHT